MATVYELFRDSAARFRDRPLLHIPADACRAYAEGAVDLTFGAMLRRVEGEMARYRRAGYGPGHRVALALENRPDFFVHWLALNGLGVSVVPLNVELPGDEMAYILGHSEVCLVLACPEYRNDIRAAVSAGGLAVPVLAADDPEAPAGPREPARNAACDADSECAVLYTSGSTGKPRGCVLSNEYFFVCGDWYRSRGGLCALEEGAERLLTPLPLVHMNAMACSSMAMILSGGCLVQLDRFHPRNWWRTVRESGATIVHYLGVMPAMLLGFPERPDDRDHRVKFGFGAGVNARHHAPFEKRFGFPLIEAWAMTESGCAGATVANREPRHVGTSCIGRPGAEIEVRLVDAAGREVGSGEPGELLVRAGGENPRRGFFSAYLKDPEATAAAWKRGYLNTGDVVREGEDGQLHFVDRRKNMIRRSGENISALEVETALSESPLVAQAAVAPVPDEVRGDEVMAAIIPVRKTAADDEVANRIFRHCYETLAYYKTPGYIGFVDALPVTASQKPRRAELKALCRELVEQGRCFDLRALKRRRDRAGA